jgi:hypothetical protein
MSIFERLRKQREDKSNRCLERCLFFAVTSSLIGILLAVLALAIFFR